MPRFEISVCDGETCSVVGRSNNPDVAKRKLAREVRKRARKLKGQKIPEGTVRGEVRQLDRGIPAEEALYVAEEHYGPPRKRRPRRKQSE